MFILWSYICLGDCFATERRAYVGQPQAWLQVNPIASDWPEDCPGFKWTFLRLVSRLHALQLTCWRHWSATSLTRLQPCPWIGQKTVPWLKDGLLLASLSSDWSASCPAVDMLTLIGQPQAWLQPVLGLVRRLPCSWQVDANWQAPSLTPTCPRIGQKTVPLAERWAPISLGLVSRLQLTGWR